MRLFIAIELPNGLKKELERLRTAIPGARWVPTEQLHLTLAFLGEVDEETTGKLNDRETEKKDVIQSAQLSRKENYRYD